MKLSSLLLIWSLVAGSETAIAADEPATVSGSNKRVEFIRREQTMFLHVNQTADAFGWQAKVVTPGKLLTLCREEKGGVCIPLRLDEVRSLLAEETLFVEATALARALRFSIDDQNGSVVLSPAKPQDADNDADIPAYNATWGKGRGFRVGQTLPDIPLYDMQGREVRFSSFLGKQYIVYCWASW